MVKIYLHSSHVLMAWCLINLAQGQFCRFYLFTIDLLQKEEHLACVSLFCDLRNRCIIYAVSFWVWVKPKNLLCAQILSANKRYVF
jgi:hypothetical protein